MRKRGRAAAFILALASLIGTLSLAREFIAGGERAKPGEYPAVVSIALSGSSAGIDGVSEAFCTGFLVHPRLILTAAHCLQGRSRIEKITNAANADSGKDGRKFSPGRFKAFPDFVLPSRGRSDAENATSAATDIGYVLLETPIPETEIAPIPVFPTSDNPSMQKLGGVDATLVGYGATTWEPSGNYDYSPIGVKNIGKKRVTGLGRGYVELAGEKGAALPGDSGGPILGAVDGAVAAFALNHGMTRETRRIPKTDRNGKIKTDKNGEPKTKEVESYGATVGTMLTTANLCWVERESGVVIAGVDCPAPAETAK